MDDSEELFSIEGVVPSIAEYNVKGCRFAGRCPYADDACRADNVGIRDTGGGHLVRCIHAEAGQEA
jgi:oligopeptide/dipeptide ABC transporter ATP-binding protein